MQLAICNIGIQLSQPYFQWVQCSVCLHSILDVHQLHTPVERFRQFCSKTCIRMLLLTNKLDHHHKCMITIISHSQRFSIVPCGITLNKASPRLPFKLTRFSSCKSYLSEHFPLSNLVHWKVGNEPNLQHIMTSNSCSAYKILNLPSAFL